MIQESTGKNYGNPRLPLDNCHALIIGVAKYSDPTLQLREQYVEAIENDAKEVSSILLDPTRCGCRQENLQLLLNASKNSIVSGLKELAHRANKSKIAVIYFSGHGYHYKFAGHTEQYLLGSDSDLNNLKTALSGSEFTELLKKIPAENLLIILDACKSGGLVDFGRKGLGTFTDGISQEYIQETALTTGRVMLSSSRSNEDSFIFPTYPVVHSLFTKVLLDGLRGNLYTRGDGYVRISDISHHLQKTISCIIDQHPGLSANTESDFPISRIVKGEVYSSHSGPNPLSFLSSLDPKVVEAIGRLIEPDPYKADIHRLVEDYTEIFGGRDSELRELDKWFYESDKPYGLLIAPTGLGKTSLLLHWVINVIKTGNVRVCFHPISQRYETASADSVFRSLAYSLANWLEDRLPSAQTSPENLRLMVTEYLRNPFFGEHPVLIVIDGMDEAVGWSINRDIFPKVLPPGIKILCSTRQTANSDLYRWQEQLGWESQKVQSFSLSKLNSDAVQTIANDNITASLDIAEKASIVNRLEELCEGDPLTLWFLIKAVNRGEVTLQNCNALTPGLRSYLSSSLEILRRSASQSPSNLDFLLACATAYGPLTTKDLVKLNPTTLNSAVLVRNAASDLSRYIIGDGRLGSGYIFSHRRLQEIFVEDLLDTQELFHWKNKFIGFIHETIEKIALQCAELDERQKIYTLIPDFSNYVLHYAAAHFSDLKMWEVLQQLLFRTLRIKNEEINFWAELHYLVDRNYDGFLSDLDIIWQQADKNNDYSTQFFCGLIHSSVISLSSNIPPLVLVELVQRDLWSWSEAIRHANKIPTLPLRGQAYILLWPYLPSHIHPQIRRNIEEIVQIDYSQHSGGASETLEIDLITGLIDIYIEEKMYPEILDALHLFVKRYQLSLVIAQEKFKQIFMRLSDRVPESFFDDLLEFLNSLGEYDGVGQAPALQLLIPVMPPAYLKKTCKVIYGIDAIEYRVDTLCFLLDHVNDELRKEIIQHLLQVVSGSPSPMYRSFFDTEIDDAIGFLNEILNSVSETEKMLFLDILEQRLENIPKPIPYTKNLAVIINHVSIDRFKNALDLIHEPVEKLEMIASCASKLPESLILDGLSILEKTPSIRSNLRFETLQKLLYHIPNHAYLRIPAVLDFPWYKQHKRDEEYQLDLWGVIENLPPDIRKVIAENAISNLEREYSSTEKYLEYSSNDFELFHKMQTEMDLYLLIPNFDSAWAVAQNIDKTNYFLANENKQSVSFRRLVYEVMSSDAKLQESGLFSSIRGELIDFARDLANSDDYTGYALAPDDIQLLIQILSQERMQSEILKLIKISREVSSSDLPEDTERNHVLLQILPLITNENLLEALLLFKEISDIVEFAQIYITIADLPSISKDERLQLLDLALSYASKMPESNPHFRFSNDSTNIFFRILHTCLRHELPIPTQVLEQLRDPESWAKVQVMIASTMKQMEAQKYLMECWQHIEDQRTKLNKDEVDLYGDPYLVSNFILAPAFARAGMAEKVLPLFRRHDYDLTKYDYRLSTALRGVVPFLSVDDLKSVKVYLDKILSISRPDQHFSDLAPLFARVGLYAEGFELIQYSDDIEDWREFIEAWAPSDLSKLMELYERKGFFKHSTDASFLHCLGRQLGESNWIKDKAGVLLSVIAEIVDQLSAKEHIEYYVKQLILLIPILEKDKANDAIELAWKLSWQIDDPDDKLEILYRDRCKELLISYATPEQVDQLYVYTVKNRDSHDFLLLKLFPSLKEDQRSNALRLLIDSQKNAPPSADLVKLHMHPSLTRDHRKEAFHAILDLTQYESGRMVVGDYEITDFLTDQTIIDTAGEVVRHKIKLTNFWDTLDKSEVSEYWVALNRKFSQYRRSKYLANLDLFVPTLFRLNGANDIADVCNSLQMIASWWP